MNPNPAELRHWHRQFAGASRFIWLLLVASILFFSGVRIYLQREETRALSETLSLLSDEGSLIVEPIVSPIRAERLFLRWQDLDEADHYLLRVASEDRGMLFDRLRVYETAWFPSDDLVASMMPGPYVWEVEALESDGRVIARSGPASFEICR